MKDLLTRYRTLALASLTAVAVAVAVAVVVILRFPGGDSAIAQETIIERIAALCASTTPPQSFDMAERATFYGGAGSGVAEYDYRTNGRAVHNITTLDGTSLQEAIFVFIDSNARSALRANAATATTYIREYSDGAWGEWNVTTGGGVGATDGGAPGDSPLRTDDGELASFCGLTLEGPPGVEIDFRYEGTETIDGILTHHFFHGYTGGGSTTYLSTEYWIDETGLLRRHRDTSFNPATDANAESKVVRDKYYSGWGEENIITPPVDPTPGPSPTPAATETPVQPETPVPPTNTPTPVSPPGVDAWLEPDPETITFDGQWRRFTIRGTGLDEVDFSINVINYPDGPSSTGAVELESGSSLPPASDACRKTYFSGYAVSIGFTFHLVGCQAGTVILRFEDPTNGYAIIREYTITVSGGP